MNAREDRPSPLVEARGLTKYFYRRQSLLQRLARETVEPTCGVDGIDLEIHRGEILGLVGESGSGKTTTGLLILRLLAPTAGDVFYDGRNLLAVDARELRALRRDMQVVFQDPFASLNPRMTIGRIVAENLIVQGMARGRELSDKVQELIETVGLSPMLAKRYPHQLSGGERQRVAIARALATRPRFLVLDEAVASLDISVGAQILNLLKDLRFQFNLSYLLITHDLRVVRYMCNRVAVMHSGKIVETADVDRLFDQPEHSYTKALLAAIPALEADAA